MLQILMQSDHEVKSSLETQLRNLSGTPMGRSRYNLGSGGQKEEFPQQEIGRSKTDYQVSTKPTPGASVLVDTSPADEKQMEAKPSRHMGEVQEPIL
jgi:hypothetical protein